MARQQLAVIEAPPQPDPAHVPALREVSPEYAKLVDRRDELRRMITQLETELANAADSSMSPAWHTERVAALIDGHPVPAAGAVDHVASLRSDLAAARSALKIVEERVPAAINAASRAIRDQVAPHYRELVHQLAVAAGALHRANLRYTAFTDLLTKRGIRWSALGPAFPVFVGAPHRNGPVGSYLRELARDQLITRDEIPVELR